MMVCRIEESTETAEILDNMKFVSEINSNYNQDDMSSDYSDESLEN
jgi:hypothetical protein